MMHSATTTTAQTIELDALAVTNTKNNYNYFVARQFVVGYIN